MNRDARRARSAPLSRAFVLREDYYQGLPAGAPSTRVAAVDLDIFRLTITPDCLAFSCAFCANPAETVTDACCSWGVDADAHERRRIEARRAAVEPHLDPASRGAEWFQPERVVDVDFPSGEAWSTHVIGGKCAFLRRGHGRRGCGLHAAALAAGEAPYALKPLFCSLFPLTLDRGVLTHVKGDLFELTCSQSGPTLFDVQSATLSDLFGAALVAELAALRDATSAPASSPPPRSTAE